MTLELVELGPTNFDLLDAIERTPEPTDEWVREVEDFILGPAVHTHLDEPASFIVAVKIDGDVRGAIVHHPLVEYPGSEYISAVLLDHRSRGQGRGRSLVEASCSMQPARAGVPTPFGRCIRATPSCSNCLLLSARSLRSTGKRDIASSLHCGAVGAVRARSGGAAVEGVEAVGDLLTASGHQLAVLVECHGCRCVAEHVLEHLHVGSGRYRE